MVLPVTGPTSVSSTIQFGNKQRQKWSQAKPIDRPLNYRMAEQFGIQQYSAWKSWSYVSPVPPTKNASFSLESQPTYAAKKANALNLAYARLKAKSSDSAGWAENLATLNKSRVLLVDSCSRLLHVVDSLRKGRFDRLAMELGMARAPSGVSRRKHISQNFLAFEYGVKPLISDVQSSMKILTSDPGRRRITSQAMEYLANRYYSATSGPGFFSTSQWVYQGTLQIKLSAYLRIYNPDLFLANQLGFLDLALPWKLIPFSFVWDWFVNVEDVISSLTDFYGAALEDAYTTEFSSGERRQWDSQYLYYPSGASEGNSTIVRQSSVLLSRTLGISGPTLQIKPFRGFSLERGAQAVSLILSTLGR